MSASQPGLPSTPSCAAGPGTCTGGQPGHPPQDNQARECHVCGMRPASERLRAVGSGSASLSDEQTSTSCQEPPDWTETRSEHRGAPSQQHVRWWRGWRGWRRRSSCRAHLATSLDRRGEWSPAGSGAVSDGAWPPGGRLAARGPSCWEPHREAMQVRPSWLHGAPSDLQCAPQTSSLAALACLATTTASCVRAGRMGCSSGAEPSASLTRSSVLGHLCVPTHGASLNLCAGSAGAWHGERALSHAFTGSDATVGCHLKGRCSRWQQTLTGHSCTGEQGTVRVGRGC